MGIANRTWAEFASPNGRIPTCLPSASALIFFTFVSMIIVALPTAAQQLEQRTIAELMQKKAYLQDHLSETQRKLDKARQVQTNAQSAESKAESLNDSNAESIARQAMTVADQAIETNQRALAKDEADLAAVNALLESRNTGMSASAAALVDMLNAAAQNLKLPKGGAHFGESLNCKFYFQGLGAELRKRGLAATSDVWSNEELSANEIVSRIESGNSEWKSVSDSDVQKLANEGMVVVGLASGSSHGHIAVAFPTPAGPDLSSIPGKAPFIRDGDEHAPDTEADHKLYPSTWGAVRANRVFSKSAPPQWYVWTPSMSTSGAQ